MVMPGAPGSGMAPVTRTRRFFFSARIALASASISGATITSTKSLAISAAVVASRGRLTAMMPPKALTGSQASARA